MGSSPSGHAQLQAGGWRHRGLWQVPSEPTANGGCVCWGWTPKKPARASGVPPRRMPASSVPGAAPNTGGGGWLPSSLQLTHLQVGQVRLCLRCCCSHTCRSCHTCGSELFSPL